MQITTIGFDLAKNVFQVHGIDADEKVVVRKELRRSQVMAFFEALARAWWVGRTRAWTQKSGAPLSGLAHVSCRIMRECLAKIVFDRLAHFFFCGREIPGRYPHRVFPQSVRSPKPPFLSRWERQSSSLPAPKPTLACRRYLCVMRTGLYVYNGNFLSFMLAENRRVSRRSHPTWRSRES